MDARPVSVEGVLPAELQPSASALSLTLPFGGTANSTTTAFRITQTGTGQAGYFQINNPSNLTTAVRGETNGRGSAVLGVTFGSGPAGEFRISSASNARPALQGFTVGSGTAVWGLASGIGTAGVFQIDNASSLSTALQGRTNGAGHAVWGFTSGSGRAGVFQINNASNTSPTLLALTTGSGPAVQGITFGAGRAGFFQNFNTTNPTPAVYSETRGTGPVLLANHTGSTGPLAVFQTNGANRARISRTGKAFFNGGTQTGGADVAEAFEVEGEVGDYRPGDVLVISRRSDRRVEKAAEPYSTRVIGIYATKPGVLLSDRDIDDGMDDMVPVGVLGVIPTRVSAENGEIRRGDLLVTSRTPGHAMRAQPVEIDGIKLFPNGSLLGKALEAFEGPGRGVIQVLVNVK